VTEHLQTNDRPNIQTYALCTFTFSLQTFTIFFRINAFINVYHNFFDVYHIYENNSFIRNRQLRTPKLGILTDFNLTFGGLGILTGSASD